jgi:hypothetical protein
MMTFHTFGYAIITHTTKQSSSSSRFTTLFIHIPKLNKLSFVYLTIVVLNQQFDNLSKMFDPFSVGTPSGPPVHLATMIARTCIQAVYIYSKWIKSQNPGGKLKSN